MNKSTSIAYIDLLTCLFVFFVIAFAIVFAQQKMDESRKADIEAKAEFMILVDWTQWSKNDVDTWIQDPYGNFVSFKQKEITGMVLERDDLGKDTKNPYRREVVTIRETRPGKYIVNVMMFTMLSKDPEPVKIQVIKINPFEIVSEKEITFTSVGQEFTAVNFWVDKDGKVTNIDENTQTKIGVR